MARCYLAQFGLTDWDFAWDRAKRRAGQTNFTHRRISLSHHIATESTPGQVRDTLLHEIAHALVGPGHGHDATWKEMASKLGATPRARGNFPVAPGRWVATCSAGHQHSRHRKPTRDMSCGLCSRRYSEQHRLVWHDTRTDT